MPKALDITVMLGGPSAEREVSLRSGAAVAQALRSLGHHICEVDPKDPNWSLPSRTDVVFLALHGTYGEDGTVQARLEEIGVPYTGCGPEASRVAFDKRLTKERCLAAGVATPRFALLSQAAAPWPDGWQPPVVLKPLRQGSSVGLAFVESLADWPAALLQALRYDSEVLMEEKILGREITAGILGLPAVAPGRGQAKIRCLRLRVQVHFPVGPNTSAPRNWTAPRLPARNAPPLRPSRPSAAVTTRAWTS